MSSIFNTANSSSTYTVPSDVDSIYVYVRGSKGGSGGDGYSGGKNGTGGLGGEGGYVEGRISVTGGDTFTINVGAGGSDGQDAYYDGSSYEYGSGGAGGNSPNNHGGSGGHGDSSSEGAGGGGGGGGGETRVIRDSDTSTIARAEAGGGGGGAGYDEESFNEAGGGGGGGARGGSGGNGPGNAIDGSNGGGTGSGGDGGNGGYDFQGDDGYNGGQQAHADLSNVTTTTGGSNTTKAGEVEIIEQPSAPSSLSAVRDSAYQASLSWTDNSGNENGFNIYRGTSSGSYTKIGSVGSNTTTYTDTTAKGDKYYYVVTSYNKAGDSDNSNEDTAIVAMVVKQWDGSKWVKGAVRNWNGSSWEYSAGQYWDGSKWVKL